MTKAKPRRKTSPVSRRVHREEITARDRYTVLYEFAPIGYLTLNHLGVINEINLTGAAVLNRPRHFLLGMPLSSMIKREHRAVLADFLQRALAHTGAAPPQVEIRTKRTPERVVRLIGRPSKGEDGDELFSAMIDLTEERRLGNERTNAHDREQRKASRLQNEIAVRVQAEERVKALLERLVQVQERERHRLALNLHDQLGQQLTALRLTIDALKSTPADSTDAQRRFEMIERIVTQLDHDVDFLAWELRPAALDDVGLEAAAGEFLRQWSALHGLKADFHTSLSPGRLPWDIESHLYRIIQEAMNNVGKHANARHVSVLLERRADEVRLIIEDDGDGFDPDGLRRHTRHRGMGLAGMQERAVSIGGQLECESAPGKGTTLFVRIPVRASAPSMG